MEEENMLNYIYLIQEREFIRTKEDIFKIGMTQKEHLERFKQYPNGSKLLIQILCEDCKYMEKYIINIFKKNFVQCNDIGNEYFKGDYKKMIDIIYNCIKFENSNNHIENYIKDEFTDLNKEELENNFEEYMHSN